MSNIDKAVAIRCEGARTLKLDELLEFQGNLKDLSEEDYNKFKRVILSHGFSEPISVWQHEGKNHIVNGHQRLRVLKGLEAEGYFIPPLPVSIVMADDEKQAREKVLTLTSQYGEVTDTGLYEYMTMSGIDVSFLDKVRLVEIDQDKWREGFAHSGDVAMPELSSGDREGDVQVTLTLTNEQKTILDKAIAKCSSSHEFERNENGNAIAKICEQYIENES